VNATRAIDLRSLSSAPSDGAPIPAHSVGARLLHAVPDAGMGTGPGLEPAAEPDCRAMPDTDPDVLTGQLDALLPGPDLAALADEVDLRSCRDETVVALAAAAARLQAWASSVEIRATRTLVDRAGRWRGVRPFDAPPQKDTVPADRMAAVEVAAALGLSSRAAQGRVALALELDRAPATKEALRRGQVPLYTARTVLEQVRPLDDDKAAAVEAKVMERYAARPHADVARALKRAVVAADPSAAEKRRKRGVEDRTLEHYSLDDGMASATMTGPAEDVHRFWEYATAAAIAGKGPGDGRTLAQCRFDVLADLGAVALAHDTTRPDLLCHPGAAPGASAEEAAGPGAPARRLAKAMAVARPIPLSPPVIRATLPLNLPLPR